MNAPELTSTPHAATAKGLTAFGYGRVKDKTPPPTEFSLPRSLMPKKRVESCFRIGSPADAPALNVRGGSIADMPRPSAMGGNRTVPCLGLGEEVVVRLDVLQLAWTLATAAFFTLLLLDIADLVEVPPLCILAASGLLLLIGWRVMPSVAQLEQMQRRRRP